jgi:two-component system probable response regulator PhcQ
MRREDGDPPRVPAQLRVVVVDDNAGVLSVAVKVLKHLDVHVMATTDANEALAWLATHEVAVVVSDYEMPLMNGAELLAQARNEQPAAVRILMTGMQALETAVDAINRGEIFRYIQKPFDPSKLRAVVDEAVARHRELALVAADHEAVAGRDTFYRELERAHPGMTHVARDVAGVYVVPDVCDADARIFLGLAT